MAATPSKLVEAIRRAHRDLKPFRENRRAAIRQYCGSHWSDNAAPDKVPLNLIQLAADIHLRLLTPSRPAVYITARRPDLRSIAHSFESQLNEWAAQSNLARTLQLLIYDALFLAGFCKVGVAPAGNVELYGQPVAIGKPYVSRISADDWFHDTEAMRWEDMRFCGHYYAADLEGLQVAAQAGEYNAAIVAKLTASTAADREEGDPDRTQEIGVPLREHERNEIDEQVELIEVYRPRQRLVVTFAENFPEEPLRVAPWQGPPEGPYHMLGLADVPDSVMPLPPVAGWRALHDPANHVLRKIIRQIERSKKLTAARLGGDADLERVRDAADGDVVSLQAPEQTKELNFGGFTQESLAFVIGIKDVFNWTAGNLDILGGLSAQSDTLGQDKILAESASRKVREYQDRVQAFMRRILKAVAFNIWNDPYLALPTPYQHVPGTDINVPIPFGPQDRQGLFNDYLIELTPHAMVSYTPQERSQTLQAIVRELSARAPMLMSQGLYIDEAEVLRQHARLLNLPELEYIVRFAGPVPPVAYGQLMGGPGGGGGAAGQPPPNPNKPNGNYVRTNRPGRTRSGSDYALMQGLLGKGTQPAERAAAAGAA